MSNLLLKSEFNEAFMCGGLEYRCPHTSSPALEQNSVATALDYEAMLLYIFTEKQNDQNEYGLFPVLDVIRVVCMFFIKFSTFWFKRYR